MVPNWRNSLSPSSGSTDEAYTGYLIKEAKVDGTKEPAGYHMNLQVIADSIQAAPSEAVDNRLKGVEVGRRKH